MAYFIQKTKWTDNPPRVTIIHTGPFKERKDAVERLTNLRKNKHTQFAIIEKENN
jgi:hypothetical protein